MIKFIFVCFLALTLNLVSADRIVTVGGIVTETVFALGAGEKVVAVDKSSVYPAEAENLPQVGYWRQLPAEGVIAMRPDLVIASEETGPASALDKIRQTGVKVVVIPMAFTLEQAVENINTIAELIDKKDEAKGLITKLKNDFKTAAELSKSLNKSPKTAFVYIRGGKIFNIGGANTYADAMIDIAGGNNVAKDLDDWKPVSTEFFAKTMPELLIVTEKGLESIGGIDYLNTTAGMSLVPAIRHKNVLIVDDLAFLGFGPRVGEALIETVKAMKKVSDKAKK